MGTPPRAVVVSPRYPGAEQLGPAGAHSTPDLAAHPLPADALEERPGPGRHGVFERPPRPLRYQPRGSTHPPPARALPRAPGRRLRLAAERDSGTRCAGAAPRSDQVSLGREAKESARSVQRPAAGPRVPAVGRAESGEDAGGVQQHLLGHAHRAHHVQREGEEIWRDDERCRWWRGGARRARRRRLGAGGFIKHHSYLPDRQRRHITAARS